MVRNAHRQRGRFPGPSYYTSCRYLKPLNRGINPCEKRKRIHAVEHSAASTPCDPFSEKRIYDDQLFDKVMIHFITLKISEKVGERPSKQGYDAFVEMSEAIMRGRTPAQQQVTVLEVLYSVLPAFIPWAARTFFRPTELTCFICAFFAKNGFAWLVGDMELQEREVELPSGEVICQLSTVHIKKCRYLEQSGCVGMCINMCKVPTQSFFTDTFGMPLYMEPNFEDLSCNMVFGQTPPPLQDDPVSKQPCFSICPLAKHKQPSCSPPLQQPPPPATRDIKYDQVETSEEDTEDTPPPIPQDKLVPVEASRLP